MIHSQKAVSFLAVAFTAALVGSGCLAQSSADDASDLAAPASEEGAGPAVGSHDEEATGEAKEACGGGLDSVCFNRPFLNTTDFVFRRALCFLPCGFFNFGPLGFSGFGPCCGCAGW